MKWKLQMEPEKVYEMVITSVTRARGFTDDVEWSCEDGTRTEHDFLCRCVEAAIRRAQPRSIFQIRSDTRAGGIFRAHPDAA